MVASLLALAAAFLFAVSTAVQHRATHTGPKIAGTARQSSAALVAVIAQPLWLLGIAADGLGFACHAYALTYGNLAVVQPLLVTGLLFALPLEAVLSRRRITVSELVCGSVVVVTLAIFLGLARPSGGSSVIENGPAVSACVCALIIAIACVLMARTPTETRRAASFGVLTGMLFALSAALVKAVGSSLSNDVDSIFTTWPLYVLLIIGPASLAINQLAFQAGPLSASLPALTAVDPLVSILLGVWLFDERLHGGPISASFQAAALVLMVLAIVQLARAKSVNVSN